MVENMTGDGLREFLTDQMGGLEDLVFRAMFGGHGIYSGGLFFGVLTREERLFFKTDEINRPDYEARGMDTFLKNFYAVPAEVIEDADELLVWARKAIAVQVRAQAPRPQRKAARRKGA